MTAGLWVGDWIWASLAIALSVLQLRLGVSEDINFQRSENGLKIILLCKIFFGCRWGILQSN